MTRRAWRAARVDNVAMLAGAVAFFAFLALVPTLIAALTLYGLVADPTRVSAQIQALAGALPAGARELITSELTEVAAARGGALTLGLVVSLVAALWSASGGTAHLMTAINVVYDEQETRGYPRQKATALVLTLAGIVFVLVALALVAGLPVVLTHFGLGTAGRIAAQVLGWLVLIALVIIGLAVVYRVAPDRDAPKFHWVSPGSLTATALWVLGSAAFNVYVSLFGHYNKIYGALTGVVVLLLWLYLSCYVVLLGAEVNTESERQTARDSTVGPPAPMGRRDARAADTLASPD